MTMIVSSVIMVPRLVPTSPRVATRHARMRAATSESVEARESPLGLREERTALALRGASVLEQTETRFQPREQ